MKSKFNYVWLLLLVIVLTSQGLLAQTKITGSIKDDNGKNVPGATVLQQNTQNGVLTEAQGNYSITLTPGGSQSLQITFIGYLQQTVPAKGKSVLNIVLKEDKVALSEVVVMGRFYLTDF